MQFGDAMHHTSKAKKEVRFDVVPGGRTVVLETWSRFEQVISVSHNKALHCTAPYDQASASAILPSPPLILDAACSITLLFWV